VGTYTVTDPALTGTVVTPNTAAASDSFPVSAGETYVMLVINGGGSPDSVVIDDPNSVGPAGNTSFNPDVTKSVTNGTNQVFRIAADRFKDVNGNVNVTHSFTTSVTVYVFRGGRV